MKKGLRDFLVFLTILVVGFGGLYAFTGLWPPAVIVESSSMMHADAETHFGRFGTIDPGDSVLVRAEKGPTDVDTFLTSGSTSSGRRRARLA